MYERKVVPPPAAARDAAAAGPGQAPNGLAAPRPSLAPGVGGPGPARVQRGQRAGPWPGLTRRGRRSQVRLPPCLSGSGPGTLRPAASVTGRCRPSRVQPKLGHHKECAVCAPLPQTGNGRLSSLLHGVLSVSEPGRAPTRQDHFTPLCAVNAIICAAAAALAPWSGTGPAQRKMPPGQGKRAGQRIPVACAATLPVSCLLLLMFAGS